MITFSFTNHPADCSAWDTFLYSHPRGIYCQYSDWVQSYESYGFSSGLLLIKDKEKLVGGVSYVVASFLFFKFTIVPCGPVVLPGYESQIDSVIQQLYQKAKTLRCCYFQLSLPLSAASLEPTALSYLTEPYSSFFFTGKAGTYFKYVVALYGMRTRTLVGETMVSLREGYSKNHIRNVQKGMKYDLQFRWLTAKETEKIAAAFQCFEQNAHAKGYPIRTYSAMQTSVQALIDKGFAKMGVCEWQGILVGALYVMVCGGRYTYIHGGVLQDHHNKGVSHFMHDWVMRDALQNGHSFYDISVGGSGGVLRFKQGFGSQLIPFEEPRYWVLNPLVFRIYTGIEPFLKYQKSKVASMLYFLKKKK